MPTRTPEARTSQAAPSPTRPLTSAELSALVEKVYRLMQQDIRMEQARGVRPKGREER